MSRVALGNTDFRDFALTDTSNVDCNIGRERRSPVAFALSFHQLFSDSVGESHFASVNIELVTRDFAPPAESFDVSDFTAASRCGFVRVPSGWVGDLHPSPMCLWVFFLRAGRLSSRPVTVNDVASRQAARYCLRTRRARGIRVVSLATCPRFSPWFRFDVAVSVAGAQVPRRSWSCSRRHCQSEPSARTVLRQHKPVRRCFTCVAGIEY